MHTLILGRTGTGKTSLLKLLSNEYRRRGIESLIFTSIRREFEGYGHVHYDLDEFLSVVFASRRCAVFVDEAGEAVDRSHITKTAPLATRSRHLGHAVHFSAQRASMIWPTVRDQCERAYIFRVSISDARDLANDYGFLEIAQASAFQPGEYFVVDRRGCQKRSLDLAKLYGKA